MSSGSGACAACLRRAHLITALAGRIERARGERRLPELLALDDETLRAAVTAERRAGAAGRDGRMSFDERAARGRCAAAGLTAICRHDDRYPHRLRDADDAPAVLFVAGDVARLLALGAPMDEAPAVAIVGARRSTPYGVEVARALGRGLAAAGVVVVSGMAFGVDAAAHAGALEVGGPTITVLAGGADVPYPRSKRRLYARIVGLDGAAAGGCAVSEHPPGFSPFKWCFPARNRIIAGLAGLTVVVEAAERSGSLITADLAAGLGRPVGAVPGQVTAPQAAGANALLADGAIVVRDARDALDALLGTGASDLAPRPQIGAGLPGHLLPVLEAVAAGRDTVAQLATTPEEARAARLALTELELLGSLRRDAGGRYVVTPS